VGKVGVWVLLPDSEINMSDVSREVER